MTENLKNYLINNNWENNSYGLIWTRDIDSECYSGIDILPNNTFVYWKDCPDIWSNAEDFPPDIKFYCEQKLIEFLEKKQLTNGNETV